MLSMGLMVYPSMLGSLSIKSNVCLLATARRLKRNSISEKNRTTY
jgi:hypothetical protein